MREIKFRAWNKHGMAYFTFKEVTEFDGTPGRCTWPEPTEIMQYTGLKDKNGKDIYEGDILKFADKIVATVVWDFAGWSYKWIDKTYKAIRSQNPEPFFRNISLNEVVGNIYQNPELLNSSEIKSSYQHPKL